MPRIPKSMTCTPSGYCLVISLRATSNPKPSSPKKMLPMHAISIRLAVFSDEDAMLMYPSLMFPLHLPVVLLPQGRSRKDDREICVCPSASALGPDHHPP